MAITLRPEHERLVSEAIQTGVYANSDEVIERALELLQSEEKWLHGQRDEIHEKIERAFAQFERGEFCSPEESRADMERRKTAWLAEQKR